MDREKAREILKALADGLDPSTGELTGKDSMLQQPDTVRALHLALTAIEQAETRQPSASAKNGTGWSPEEDEKLCKELYGSVDFAEMANIHGRSRSEIVSRLVALGKIKPKGTAREVA
jgi:hypothetical protein